MVAKPFWAFSFLTVNATDNAATATIKQRRAPVELLETWLTPWCSTFNTDHGFDQGHMGLKTKDSTKVGLSVDDIICCWWPSAPCVSLWASHHTFTSWWTETCISGLFGYIYLWFWRYKEETRYQKTPCVFALRFSDTADCRAAINRPRLSQHLKLSFVSQMIL